MGKFRERQPESPPIGLKELAEEAAVATLPEPEECAPAESYDQRQEAKDLEEALYPPQPWQVSLGSMGPTTPDPNHTDPVRRLPIMARDRAEARQKFMVLHGILKMPREPDILQLKP